MAMDEDRTKQKIKKAPVKNWMTSTLFTKTAAIAVKGYRVYTSKAFAKKCSFSIDS
jgi:hypothetical protein